MTNTDSLTDRVAIFDLVNALVNCMDFKDFDGLTEIFTEDVETRWGSPTGIPKVSKGRDAVIDLVRKRLMTDEVVTCHQVFNFTPEINGDAAFANIRLRAMHAGRGKREGAFYESLGFQPTNFARTPSGWKCSAYEWQIVEKFGNFSDVFGDV